MKKPAFKGALAAASSLYLFSLGLETGGFQYSLLTLAGDLALDSAAMGLLPAAQYAALTLAPLTMGHLSDRVDKKMLYLLGILCSALGCLLAPLANSALFLGFCAFLIGWGQGLGGFLNAALLAQVYPTRSASYMNFTQSFFSLGAVISPLLAAYCAQRFGTSWQLPFLVSGAVLLVSLLTLSLADCAPASVPISPASGRGSSVSFFSLLRSPSLLLMAGILIYVSVENGAAFYFDPLFSLELGAARLSAYAISGFWLAMFLARFFSGVLNISPNKLVLFGFGGTALALLAPALSKSAPMALIACLGMGFFCGPTWPLMINAAARVNPAHAGATSAAALAITGLGAAISQAVLGLLGSLSSYRQIFLVLFAISCLAVGLWLLYIRAQGKAE